MIADLAFKQSEIIQEFQNKELINILSYVSKNSAFYQTHFDGIDVSAITNPDDLVKLPVTTKEDIQLYNDDFLCVPKEDIIDYVTSSGTTGNPIYIGLTDRDLDRLALNEALSFEASGIKKGDTIQLMTTIDRRFMAGLAYFLGARKMKAGIIRVGAGNPELQWDSILKFKPKHLIAVPSFLLKMIEYASQNNIDLQNTSIESVVCIGEPIRNVDFTPNRLNLAITSKWNVKLFSTYASTEMGTAFAECEHQVGGHQHPELIIVEVLDENNAPVIPGQTGELTITTLQTEGMPLVRFKTGDLVQVIQDKCLCGRNTNRLSPVIGRKKQMIKYKGTTVYPPAMNDLLNDFTEIEHSIIKIEHNEIGLDQITLQLCSAHKSTQLEERIKQHFQAKIRVAPHIEWLSISTISSIKFNPKFRKPVDFIDLRPDESKEPITSF